MEKFLVTGSLAEEKASEVEMEKFLGAGALAEEEAAGEVELEKFLVTGSLAEEDGKEVELEKFLVTGSLAEETKSPPSFPFGASLIAIARMEYDVEPRRLASCFVGGKGAALDVLGVGRGQLGGTDHAFDHQ